MMATVEINGGFDRSSGHVGGEHSIMVTQLLFLFDSNPSFDGIGSQAASPVSPVVDSASDPAAVAVATQPSSSSRPVRIYRDGQRHDTIQPMGELARLVLARYDLLAMRRQERDRRRAGNPRRSIRVLSPEMAGA